MNKKKLSSTLENLYKPFQAVFGFSLAMWFLVTTIETVFDSAEVLNPIVEVIWCILTWICVFFGYLGIWCVLPIMLSAILIALSIWWAISEKNIKNILNLRLLITVALIIVSSVLQYNWLLQHF
jgi:hypothetical protein